MNCGNKKQGRTELTLRGVAFFRATWVLLATVLMHRLASIFLLASVAAWAQVDSRPLDPTRTAPLVTDSHMPLQEQYVWTAGDVTAERSDANKFPWSRADLRIEPHFFRAHFALQTIPKAATLYIAGPRDVTVYLNGQRIGHASTSVDQPINFRVFHLDAQHALRRGENVLCIEAVRGRGVVSVGGSLALKQLAYGEVLAAKLAPGVFGETDAVPLIISDRSWRSIASVTSSSAWIKNDFNDSGWPLVASLGPIESNVDFMQWSADAGMYGWPGYMGMSKALRTYSLAPALVAHTYAGAGSFQHLQSLTNPVATEPFTVREDDVSATDAEVPSLMLDFGREVAGRLLVESYSAHDSKLSIAYGESELEASATGITPMQQGGNYLGTNLLDVPAHGIARGPKSAFRYVRIRFVGIHESASFPSIRLEGITYPVSFTGSFTSSDPLLNRIWETGAYTAHLCMQDNVWDAPKRDRGRWAGDLDVEGRVIYDAFGDTAELEDTLARLGSETYDDSHVNGIPSYTALWITTLAALYERSGDDSFVVHEHSDLVRLLAKLDKDLDPTTGLLQRTQRGWGFVDWSSGFYGNTNQVWIGTTLQYLRAYLAAPALLRASGDDENGRKYEAIANRLQVAAGKAFVSAETHTVGDTWQLNTLAILSGVAGADNTGIWKTVFARVKQDSPADQVISPYFNAYLIDAMAASGHSQEALTWIRAYWGGMLAEGATSFWEAYDLRWPKTNFHLSLQADGTSGFFVSLAHGWSSGPVTWIDENILGIKPTSPGYRTVSIRPQLLGLEFAKGTVATPHGPIAIEVNSSQGITLDIPTGIEEAIVAYPIPGGASHFFVNNALQSEAMLHLKAGQYRITWK
jgi:alpha-L-rhamnosidase